MAGFCSVTRGLFCFKMLSFCWISMSVICGDSDASSEAKASSSETGKSFVTEDENSSTEGCGEMTESGDRSCSFGGYVTGRGSCITGSLTETGVSEPTFCMLGANIGEIGCVTSAVGEVTGAIGGVTGTRTASGGGIGGGVGSHGAAFI